MKIISWICSSRTIKMSTQVLDPRASGYFIAKMAKHISISSKNVQQLAEKLFLEFKKKRYNLKSWKDHELHPKELNIKSIHWILVADSLNFSFWSKNEKKKYGVKYDGKMYSGYWSIHAAIRRALKDGIPITDVEFLANLSKDNLRHILRSDTKEEIPLLEERYNCLTETGKVLLKNFQGSFENCILQSDHSAKKLMNLIVENFPSYRDEAEYGGMKVSFYKRAQILVADLWALFEGQGLGSFHDIDYLTMFADYRVPQVLVYFGAMEYSQELMEMIQKGELTHGEQYEIEIRGCSIAVVEHLKEKMKKMTDNENIQTLICNSCIIDFYLWDYRRSHANQIEAKVPFHKTRCIYY